MVMKKEKISSLSNDLKSHPDTFLKDHLLNVGITCNNILTLKKLNLDEYVDFEILKDISYLVGITHDFGKASSYFQKYINENDKLKMIGLKNKPETHHGLLSSIFTYYVVKEYLLSKKLYRKEYYKYLPIISFLIVKRHHGNLNNAIDETIFKESDKVVLERQANSIDFKNMNDIYQNLFSKISFNLDCNFVKDKMLKENPVYIYNKLKEYRKCYVEDIQKNEKRSIGNIDEEHSLFYYFITLLLYSILLDADKTDAANLEPVKRKYVSDDIVDMYKISKFKQSNTKINNMRNEIYNETISNVKKIDLEQDKILSLNVPTGTGKTLTALSFALKLRKRIEDEREYQSRIIYSLPFLSIIDQNYNVFNEVLEKPTTDILLKHHHLSEIYYTTKENDYENTEADNGKDLLLIEGWNSEIVVTTFVQFFHSLISKRNRSIRKVHNITNSIVILDEIQAIPHKYWLLLNKTLKFFANHFNTYFILLTATQPLIFDESKNEITSLISKKHKEHYFKSLNRVKLIIKSEPLIISDFNEILREDIEQNPNKDVLVVLNTINSSKQVSNFVKALNLKNTESYYLSTDIIPKKRLEIIKDIKAKSINRKIIVSTQLIEAGVDIDVDIVYRDFAPLDSINQVAGRCNRNYGKKKGIVNIFVLETENKKKYYKYIYGSFLASKTQIVLDKKEINESEFLKLNKSYFECVDIGKSEDNSNSILENVEKMEFSKLSEFRLIDKSYPEIDVFVELDKEAKVVWKKYQDIINDNQLKGFKKKNKLLDIKKQFYEYVISIPKKYAFGLNEGEMNVILQCELKNRYDNRTGFKREYSGEGSIMC